MDYPFGFGIGKKFVGDCFAPMLIVRDKFLDDCAWLIIFLGLSGR